MFPRSFGQIVFRTPSGRPEAFPKVLANLHIASRRLIFDVQTKNVQRLLVLSSVNVAELGLIGVCSLCVDHKNTNDNFTGFSRSTASHPIDLPFPIFTPEFTPLALPYPHPVFHFLSSSVNLRRARLPVALPLRTRFSEYLGSSG